jgi:hypothetical protein
MIKQSTSRSIAFKFLFVLAFGFVFTGCKDKYKPEESFIKVYNDKDGNRNYFPLGMQRTNDEGYLILSAYNGWNIHLLKTDKTGAMLWEYDLPSKYINAVPNLIARDGKIYFVCMDEVGLFTYIMLVDENAQQAIEFQQFQEIRYPLYVADNESAVYIQNYQRSTYKTGIFELSGAMDQVVQSGSVNIFTDVEDKIVDHLRFTGKRFPFFVSVTPENDYIILSGFNNYSFSTVFLNPNLNFSGVYNGAAFDGGLNAILPLGGNKYSLARFSFSNLYFNPSVTLVPNAIDIAESIPATGKAELDAESPVLIKEISIGGTDYVTYLATTKSNQLLLSFYNKGGSELLGTKYLGQSVPLKACDFAMTQDGGMMILARVTVLGSFNRIGSIKLSKAELEAVME